MSKPVTMSDDPTFAANVPLNNVVNTFTTPTYIPQIAISVFSCVCVAASTHAQTPFLAPHHQLNLIHRILSFSPK